VDLDWGVDFFVYGDAGVACEANLFEELVVELGVDGEHEDVLNGSHGLRVLVWWEGRAEVKGRGGHTCFTTFSWRSRVAPMMVTVSFFRSPPWSAPWECIAMSSFSSGGVCEIESYGVEGERTDLLCGI
jgi:hypothetical protein